MSRRSWREVSKPFERYAIAHVAAYPLALVWAVAAMPLTIHLFIRDLDAIQDDMNAVGTFIVRRVAWPAGAVFALVHLLAIPWAFGRTPSRYVRLTWIAIACLAGVGLLFGVASWIWLVTRG